MNLKKLKIDTLKQRMSYLKDMINEKLQDIE